MVHASLIHPGKKKKIPMYHITIICIISSKKVIYGTGTVLYLNGTVLIYYITTLIKTKLIMLSC